MAQSLRRVFSLDFMRIQDPLLRPASKRQLHNVLKTYMSTASVHTKTSCKLEPFITKRSGSLEELEISLERITRTLSYLKKAIETSNKPGANIPISSSTTRVNSLSQLVSNVEMLPSRRSIASTDWFLNYTLDISQFPPPPRLHRFRDALLEQLIFVHSSSARHVTWIGPDGASMYDNERLEWLGDSVLGSIIADLLFSMFARLPEGDLTNLKVALVNKHTLAKICKRLGLERRLVVRLNDPYELPSDKILSGLFEAYVGAFHLDVTLHGHHILHDWVKQLFEPFVLQVYDNYQHSNGMSVERPPSRAIAGGRTPALGSHYPTSYLEEGRYSGRLPQVDRVNFAPPVPPPPPHPRQGSMNSTWSWPQALKERVDNLGMAGPRYEYLDNKLQGDFAGWKADVFINDELYASTDLWSRSKKEAQHLVSKLAWELLRPEY